MICWHDYEPFREATYCYAKGIYYEPGKLPGDDKLKKNIRKIGLYRAITLKTFNHNTSISTHIWFNKNRHKYQDFICVKCGKLKLNLDKKIRTALAHGTKIYERKQKAMNAKEKAFKYLDLKSKADE